ncbi:hypothetical protein [Wolbachia pipientis]|uniref:hypothetical protein n=1 Tax=Wolbachia pipientis TaxID=955 RepID=UPI0038B6352C
MNLLYITHYPKSCATKPTGIQIGTKLVNMKALYNVFYVKANVSYSNDTICYKLTFTLWSCRYPEQIQYFLFIKLSNYLS